MHKKLKIVSIIIGLVPITVALLELPSCGANSGMCGLMTMLFSLPFSILAQPDYLFRWPYWYSQFAQNNEIIFLGILAIAAGILHGFVFYWIIRLIQKIFIRNS